MNKTCSICGETKNEADYYYRDKETGVRHAQCKGCYSRKRKKNWREYYYKHGSKYRENAVKRNRKLKQKLRQQMLDYLQNKSCEVCSIDDPRVLEFDHIDPMTKSFGISKGVSNTLSWDKILSEIDKCQILCANCHKIKTAKEQGWYKAV